MVSMISITVSDVPNCSLSHGSQGVIEKCLAVPSFIT